MKPRHAAALALVGWYLIIPPLKSEWTPNPDAPLSEWDITGNTLDTAAACEKVRAQVFALAKDIESGTPGFAVKDNNQRQFYVTAFRMVRCIATNDPRLTK
jgi:hypothetical protein